LPFLHFCKKYDICTGNLGAWNFGFGKIFQNPKCYFFKKILQ